MNGVDCTERLKERVLLFLGVGCPFPPLFKFLSTFLLSIYFTSLGFFYLISFCHQIRLFLRCEKETQQSIELQTYQEKKNKNLSLFWFPFLSFFVDSWISQVKPFHIPLLLFFLQDISDGTINYFHRDAFSSTFHRGARYLWLFEEEYEKYCTLLSCCTQREEKTGTF